MFVETHLNMRSLSYSASFTYAVPLRTVLCALPTESRSISYTCFGTHQLENLVADSGGLLCVLGFPHFFVEGEMI